MSLEGVTDGRVGRKRGLFSRKFKEKKLVHLPSSRERWQGVPKLWRIAKEKSTVARTFVDYYNILTGEVQKVTHIHL